MLKRRISESELILNTDGSVYHLHLQSDDVADTIITVGDPERVGMVSDCFDEVEMVKTNREFVSHTGYYKGKRITVLSTGIGTDNIDIVMNELDAAVNINLEERAVMEEKKSLQLIRIGTCGIMHDDFRAGDVIRSRYALGFDNLLHFYPLLQKQEPDWIEVITQRIGLTVTPYLTQCDKALDEKMSSIGRSGNTVTCPGFYGPQGRTLRIPPRFNGLLDTLPDITFNGETFHNFEMETAGIYGLGELLGHQCLSISLGVADRKRGEFLENAHERMHHLIREVLEVWVS